MARFEKTFSRDTWFLEAVPGSFPLEYVSICYACYAPVGFLQVKDAGAFDSIAMRTGLPLVKIMRAGDMFVVDGRLMDGKELGSLIYGFHAAHWGSCAKASPSPYRPPADDALRGDRFWFSDWHRRLQTEVAMIDIDQTIPCACGSSVVLVEWCRGDRYALARKPTTTTRKLARLLGAPAYAAAYDRGGVYWRHLVSGESGSGTGAEVIALMRGEAESGCSTCCK